ncbi:hypothetical protein [Hanstruepera flava]|uniref:hypothetical protein n=1 Tax=Hanstruepera flava TaxID=2930218 RepID=UPI002027A513|nr:hypothetical protein [Hanstruepera flava]
MIVTLSNVFGQTSDPKYLRHDHNYSTTYFYEVTEITIHSDSTYTLKSWSINNKKECKSYKEYKPEVSNGKITRNGEFLTLTEYRNGNKTDFNWTVKVFEKRLNFYYPNKNGRLIKSAKFKRIL